MASPRCVRASCQGVLSALHVPPCVSLLSPRSVRTRQESGALRWLCAEITFKAEDDFVKTWQENQANKNRPEKKSRGVEMFFFFFLIHLLHVWMGERFTLNHTCRRVCQHLVQWAGSRAWGKHWSRLEKHRFCVQHFAIRG